jgi:Leucine-rich repeat (LRR) protein
LTRLILQQNKLSSLPSSIGDLTGLQLLYIANNKLTSLPDSIGNLKVNASALRRTSIGSRLEC